MKSKYLVQSRVLEGLENLLVEKNRTVVKPPPIPHHNKTTTFFIPSHPNLLNEPQCVPSKTQTINKSSTKTFRNVDMRSLRYFIGTQP